MTVFANVIFPAFTTPYVSPILFPIAGIAAVVSELYCYRRFSSVNGIPTLSDVIGANMMSWLVGVLLGQVLPSGLAKKVIGAEMEILTEGPYFTGYAIIGFFVACLLSVFVEGWFLRFCSRHESELMEGAYGLAGIANLVSYLVLGILVWIFVAFGWFV